ncbi:hypothetical protein BBJ29_002631 [Phytophthora kernoviae]|uniref:Uncharacterized protein n=1 Tax=Phytophthora kernoviae TaxID=325452 RepID=A0A3F2RNX6_9STRA|nr:hypothetical protein BBJ29_002631 [Phytophthora kernoviae]RLN61394.1 hypothetical protein BBP00_00005420 [Phytophthora kernoviae]
MGVSSSKKVNPRPQIPGDWDVDKVPSQKGKVAIVTGTNSGIGYETALMLALKGAFVVLACRNEGRGQEAEATLHETLSTTAGGGSIVFMQVDMGDLSSVHQFCEEFKKKYDRLDLLVNNAGIVGGAYTQSVDGYELQFATSYLGHFALTAQLFELLKKSVPSRAVTVSSLLHRHATLIFYENNIMATNEKEYGQVSIFSISKLCNLLFTIELDRRIKAAGVEGVTVATSHLECYGYPTREDPSALIKSKAAANKLWTLSEKLTHLNFMKGKVAIVTGANSGLGFETALELARKGAHVVLACRNELKGTETETKLRAQLTNEPNSGTFQFMKLDVSDLSSVKMFVAEFMKTHNRLDLLINNAGVMGGSYALTVDGYERLFATNHLGHFALTAQLFELLRKSAPSRVVNVSSGLHHRADRSFNEDEIMVTREENFGQVQTYGESKLCNILFTKELNRRLQAAGVEGVVTVSCHPGYVATNLGTNMAAANSNWLWWIVISIAAMLPGGKSPEVGALPILYAATGDEVVGGDYIGPKEKLKNVGNPARPEPSELSMSESAASKLWAFSEKLAHVAFRVVKTDVGE